MMIGEAQFVFLYIATRGFSLKNNNNKIVDGIEALIYIFFTLALDNRYIMCIFFLCKIRANVRGYCLFLYSVLGKCVGDIEN